MLQRGFPVKLGRARQKIATLDRVDPGTGLVRFPYFQETMRRDLAMARRDRRFVTLLVFEIVELGVYRQTFSDKKGAWDVSSPLRSATVCTNTATTIARPVTCSPFRPIQA